MPNREAAGQPPRRAARLGRRVLVLAAAVLALVLLRRPGSPRVDTADDRVLALHPWEMLGCYRVRARPWGPAARGPMADSLLERASRAGRSSSAAEPPGRVLLLPDSVDRWGRVLPSYRARGWDGDADPGRTLRWIVRADTLWLLWSEASVRGGVALRRTGDSLAGRARVQGDTLDLAARAVAWPVNCATGEREFPRARAR